VWVDEQGYLHLKIREINGAWHSAQVTLPTSLDYGEYRFQIAANVEAFDPYVVLGMFVYEDDFNETTLK